ncbi:hypothetical protein Y032_0569g93 [Ancylostoma ceylanicum]|uniref:Uncharacterized protein n=1 Tax=Ancylostoma ceylanicum TaxID=53326 RepID=A0A016WP66_9BILA|nr:hypothetical protein Y032_0569g93 [Ancylostoma ceylanicum]
MCTTAQTKKQLHYVKRNSMLATSFSRRVHCQAVRYQTSAPLRRRLGLDCGSRSAGSSRLKPLHSAAIGQARCVECECCANGGATGINRRYSRKRMYIQTF